MTAQGRLNVHATGIVLGTIGVLIRGPSGAGKSLLALELLDRAETRGEGALLVADDRVDLASGDAGLVMHAPTATAGLIELRGRGIVSRPHRQSAPLHLVVDLVDDFVRMLEDDELATDIMGTTLPRCPVPRRGVVDSAHQLLLVGEAIKVIAEVKPQKRQKFT